MAEILIVEDEASINELIKTDFKCSRPPLPPSLQRHGGDLYG